MDCSRSLKNANSQGLSYGCANVSPQEILQKEMTTGTSMLVGVLDDVVGCAEQKYGIEQLASVDMSQESYQYVYDQFRQWVRDALVEHNRAAEYYERFGASEEQVSELAWYYTQAAREKAQYRDPGYEPHNSVEIYSCLSAQRQQMILALDSANATDHASFHAAAQACTPSRQYRQQRAEQAVRRWVKQSLLEIGQPTHQDIEHLTRYYQKLIRERIVQECTKQTREPHPAQAVALSV